MMFLKKSRLLLALLLIMAIGHEATGRIPEALVVGTAVGGAVVGLGLLGYLARKKQMQTQLTKVSQDLLYKFEEGKPELIALAGLQPQEREDQITKYIAGLQRDELIVYYSQVLYDRFVLRSMIEKNAVPNRMESVISYLSVVDEIVLHSYRLYYKAWYEKIAEDTYFATDNHITWKIAARYPQAPDGEMRTYQLLIGYREALQKIIDLLLTKPVHPDRDSTLNGAEVLVRRVDTDLELMGKNPIIARDMAARRVALTVQKAAPAPRQGGTAAAPGGVVQPASGFDRRRALKWVGGVTAAGVCLVIAGIIDDENSRRRIWGSNWY
jgi:hypothetical protein